MGKCPEPRGSEGTRHAAERLRLPRRGYATAVQLDDRLVMKG